MALTGEAEVSTLAVPMSKKLLFELHGSPVEFAVRRVLIAGYTGRDTAKVQAHIAELERQGIPAPPSVPMVYRIDPSWVTTQSEILVEPRRASGEVEAGLLFPGDGLDDALVAVISDFTDREEERRSIQRSKELPKPLSEQVWRYRDVAAVWDEIALRSWVGTGPERQLYQSGKLGELLPPPALLARLKDRLGEGMEGTVLLLGTVPLLTKEFSFSEYFACELETPEPAKLSCAYRVRHPDPKGNS